MAAYILRRILLMIPTLFGIMLITFTVTQFVPGGPVERLIAEIEGHSLGGEVRGGNKKLWKQKHTGRARMGTKKSGIWRGGGTIFGPVPRDYSYHMPKTARRVALAFTGLPTVFSISKVGPAISCPPL